MIVPGLGVGLDLVKILNAFFFCITRIVVQTEGTVGLLFIVFFLLLWYFGLKCFVNRLKIFMLFMNKNAKIFEVYMRIVHTVRLRM